MVFLKLTNLQISVSYGVVNGMTDIRIYLFNKVCQLKMQNKIK